MGFFKGHISLSVWTLAVPLATPVEVLGIWWDVISTLSWVVYITSSCCLRPERLEHIAASEILVVVMPEIGQELQTAMGLSAEVFWTYLTTRFAFLQLYFDKSHELHKNVCWTYWNMLTVLLSLVVGYHWGVPLRSSWGLPSFQTSSTNPDKWERPTCLDSCAMLAMYITHSF